MKKDNENGQGDSALRDLVNRAMRLACASLGLAEEYSGGDSETLDYLARQYAELSIEVANRFYRHGAEDCAGQFAESFPAEV